MSNFVFRNYDLKSIKNLLKEIGKERYECALKDSKIQHKPMRMEGFYIEFEVDTLDINLYYRYPSRVSFLIMPVLGYWAVPHQNWILERTD